MPAVDADDETARPARQGQPWWGRWVGSESARSTLAAVLSVLITTPVATIWLTREAGLRSYGLTIGCLVAWTVFGAIHALFTFLVCRRMSLAELADSGTRPTTAERGPGTLDESSVLDRVGARIRQGRRRWRRWSDRQNEAPSWSVQVSGLALIVVGVILFTPDLRASQGVLFAALGMVTASWINVWMMFAVHYARTDARESGLAFPGEPAQDLSDYLYFALAVQTTFGATDVEVRTRILRRIVSGHGALAFVFNSVIIAMIVSLLLGAAN